MSRMATMQVLNQSFRNLNDALNSYMENRNRSRYMDLKEQAQQLEAARNEALDRRNLLFETARMSSEYSPEVGNAYRYAAGGDPIAQNLYMQGVGKALERQQAEATAKEYMRQEELRRAEAQKRQWELDKLNRQFENQKSLAELNNAAKAQEGKLSRENQLNLLNTKLGFQKMQAELAQKQAAEKAKAAAAQADERAVYQYLTDNPDKTVMEAVSKLREMRAELNGQQQQAKPISAGELQGMVKSGKITREQAYNIAKQNGLLK